MVTDPSAIQPSTDVGRNRGATSAPTPPLTPPDAPPPSPLMDWRGFHTELQRAAIAATQMGAPLSLLMLERVGSDRISRPDGSEVAAAATAALAGAVRAAAGERALLARYSETQLAIILTDTGLGEAVGRAKQIAHQISLLGCGGAVGVDPQATAAVGVAQFQDDESLGHLIQRTAAALEQARSHRGLAVIADHAARKRPSRLLGHVRPT